MYAFTFCVNFFQQSLQRGGQSLTIPIYLSLCHVVDFYYQTISIGPFPRQCLEPLSWLACQEISSRFLYHRAMGLQFIWVPSDLKIILLAGRTSFMRIVVWSREYALMAPHLPLPLPLQRCSEMGAPSVEGCIAVSTECFLCWEGNSHTISLPFSEQNSPEIDVGCARTLWAIVPIPAFSPFVSITSPLQSPSSLVSLEPSLLSAASNRLKSQRPSSSIFPSLFASAPFAYRSHPSSHLCVVVQVVCSSDILCIVAIIIAQKEIYYWNYFKKSPKFIYFYLLVSLNSRSASIIY